MRHLAAVLFTAREQASPFESSGVIGPTTAIHEVLEGSNWFQPVEMAAARRRTGLAGDPCALWVGHLDDNKDPLTILRGFARCAGRFTDPHLWLCYASDARERDLRAMVSADRTLEGRVHFVGTVEHGSLADYYSAADVFVLGSHREGSGFALLEALACGLEPAVSDIPSFRMITRDGAVGSLFTPGDADAMAEALFDVASRRSRERRGAVRAHFDAHLSWDKVGRELQSVYRKVLERG